MIRVIFQWFELPVSNGRVFNTFMQQVPSRGDTVHLSDDIPAMEIHRTSWAQNGPNGQWQAEVWLR